jgi:plasmid stabilization system protein ParE
MKPYHIHIAAEALQDMRETSYYITAVLKAPVTSERYIEGIYRAISQLSFFGGSIAPSRREYIQRHYGPGARTVVYKKMLIVFNVRRDVIVIRRVMPGGLIR